MKVKLLVLLGLAAIVVALSACGHRGGASGASSTSSASSASGTQSSASVSGAPGHDAIKNYAFAPATLAVKAGTRITWTNGDATAHTATADKGSFDTGTINPGQSMTIDFTRRGTYTYHCAFHAFMTGTIKVVG